MEIITAIFSQINALGATITMPIIFTILGLLIGMKFSQAEALAQSFHLILCL